MHLRAVLSAVGLAAALAAAPPAHAAKLPPTTTETDGLQHAGTTVPNFTDTFTFGGVTYAYTMVGTNPRTSTSTTTVPTVLVPMRFQFADGHVIDASSIMDDVARSPIFQSAKFSSGTTQYGDAIQRAMFWKYTAKTEWHVLLGKPTIAPTVTVKVPASKGVYVPAGGSIGEFSHTGVPTGVFDDNWFFSQYGNIVHKYDPRTLPILIGRNVITGYQPLPTQCCIFGYHAVTHTTFTNGNAGIQTGIYSNWGDAPGSFADSSPDFGDNAESSRTRCPSGSPTRSGRT
jgi:hypothetical protein